MAVEDISIIRAIPGITIIDPADAEEMRCAVNACADYYGPIYLRETRDEWPSVFTGGCDFKIGRAIQLADGEDVSIISSGVMTSVSLEASEILAKEGIGARVINMSTIKPIDSEAIIKAAKETGAIVTAENHNIYGGLGSAVAEVLGENQPSPLKMIGIRDVLNEAGTNEELLVKYGMSASHIVEAVREVIKRKSK